MSLREAIKHLVTLECQLMFKACGGKPGSDITRDAEVAALRMAVAALEDLHIAELMQAEALRGERPKLEVVK